MTFSLLVLAQLGPAGKPLFDIAALVVFVSIVVHGLSDHAGAEWIARREERRASGEDAHASGAGVGAGALEGGSRT